jgi:hypothetical protein
LYSKAFWLIQWPSPAHPEVLSIDSCRIRVNGLDMFEGTPILAIKP